ncbi:MAG: hypothetical protein V3V13_01970 [Paracoccaceae bacterium]
MHDAATGGRALGKPQSFVAKVEGYERRLDVIEMLHISTTIGFDPFPLLQVIHSKTPSE